MKSKEKLQGAAAKSDVLFDTNNELGQGGAPFITDNFDAGKKTLKLAVEGFVSISEFFDDSRERGLARNQIIQSNPDLQEREQHRFTVALTWH